MEALVENPRARLSVVPLKQGVPSSSQTPGQESQQPQQLPTHLENQDVSPPAKILYEILIKASPQEVEAALTATRIKPIPEIVGEVLKLLHESPQAAIKFFRWAGIAQKHAAHSWNLMVDMLGKNRMFEPMWDAIRSMKQEGVLSVATFVLVFGSYCAAGRFNEAVMTFDVMEKYGVQPDIVAVNSLLSAICREDKQTSRALEFFERIKTKIAPDADSFTILLEGWQKEGNVAKAKTTFGEMVIRVGWSPQYRDAYDAFLTTLVNGSQVDETTKFLQVMKGKNCLPGLKFFSSAIDILVKKKDSAHAALLWDIMVGSGLAPNLIMYNAMIGLLCNNNDIDNAFRFLDEMVFYGAFPDSLSYNMIFQCLIKNKRVREAGRFFFEMIKNEWPPTHTNCAAAISMFYDRDDPEMAIEVWEYMIKNCIQPLEESANELLIGLSKMDRLTETKRIMETILDMRINIHESTMEKLKTAFYRKGKSAHDTYDSLERKWKSS
ncbi:pentatricopeptide repeat-containing protein At1g77360, mitochondrial-like [Diospyros lotus]|uniref:pentatricopeptide repeat-containing protein At1g77360, mitochondrial-like n=1 Tax=Diospyros lotus TaxID=55363 RepID=UPI00225A0743|nr:pentatricopeptide repeat-containing protein At1g77360, mitochondrial-like [Diospyros lotus]XP_052209137.1 pentatricopeptide repeat-containing protein At1g77360, mitochondrial-like [Diospyros lotus]